MTQYFVGLAPRDPGAMVALRQGMSEVDRFFTQSEIEGLPAVRLEVVFSNPVIMLPKHSHSNE